MDIATAEFGTGMSRRWRLLLPHRERLHALVRHRLRNPDDVEDCVQETLLRAAGFDGLDEDRVGAFLTATALRICVDHHRRRDHGLRLRARLATLPETGSPFADPEETVCDNELGLWLLDQATRLIGRERDVMLARACGASTAEAARGLGISPKAAESAFTRGRARLRRIHEESEHDAER